MKLLETSTNGNVFAGTFGGVLLSFFSNVFVEDLLKTIILSFVGAVISFIVSLTLKSLFKRKKD